MKKSVRIGALILSVVLTISACFTVYNAYAKTSWTETKIKEQYELLSEFEVPKREVIVNGKRVAANVTVEKPDGTATKAEKVKLDMPGMYKVTYLAEVEGQYYTEQEQFLVHNNLYTFTSENSTASFGKYEQARETEGLMVRLAEGDILSFNEPIDMTSLKENDWLIQMFATPDEVGHADFKKLCFEFTDVNDPSITFYFAGHQTYEDEKLPYTYCVAGGNDQIPKGFEQGSGNIHEEGNFGSVTIHSFGLGHEFCSEFCDDQSLNFRIDFSNMTVHTREGLVCDMDSAEFYDTVWEGFPSGKAHLKIWAESYAGKTANFCLFKAGNLDLTQEKVLDTEGPVITIDKEYKEAPLAVKGGCYQYIPTATARDMSSGECEVTTKVYYNYQAPDASVLDAKDGTFSTDKIGKYAIVYEAKDAYDNLSREIIWVEAKESLPTPSITLNKEPEKNWELGAKFVPEEYTYKCHVGNPSVRVFATKGENTYDLRDGYRFEEEGTYQITYELTDCAGQVAVYEYDMVVKVGDKPVLGEDIVMPQYMVTGTEYVFPEVHFHDYRSGKKETKIATGKILDAKGETKVDAGDTYELSVDKNGDMVTIVFECENASYEVKVPAIQAWGQIDGRSAIMLENFFVGTGFTTAKGTGITFETTTKEAGWQFANQLLSSDLIFEVQGVSKKMKYDGLEIELRDSANPKEVLTMELPYEEGTLSVKIGDKKQTLKKGVDLVTAGPISVVYKNGELTVANAKIKNLDFGGFSSDYLTLSIRFKNAQKGAAFTLFSINNHMMGESRSDKLEPKIVIQGSYGGTHEYGKEIVLPAAVSGDVLNPNVTFSMTARLGDEILTDVNGVKLENVDPTKEYTIKVDKYGKYNVSYSAEESFSEKEAKSSYMIHVVDSVQPELEFMQKQVTEAKVGDVICIPDYTVTDNETKQEDILVKKYVEDPHGKMILLTGDSNAVVASKAGEYKFIVLAVDAEGNVCNVSWTVIVSES